MSIRITCIKKAGGYHESELTAISELGWKNEATLETGRATRLEMYDWVKAGNVAYVKDAAGDVAYLITATTDRGTKYVKTKPDSTKQDNLLVLPECR